MNYLIIAACALVFFLQLVSGETPQLRLVERLGMIPERVLHPDREVMIREPVLVRDQRGQLAVDYRQRPAADPPFSAWLTLLTCIFLHGGWMHFLGNMWFLYIFGDNVEDRLGHLGYLLFYLGSGLLASAAHLAVNPSSTIPTIGASGAIAGVMGAYLVLYPRAMVVSIIPIFFIIEIMVIPAPIFLGIWFLLQFFQGTFAITATEAGGVAWWAHIGGFVVGVVVAALLRSSGTARPPVDKVLPHTDRPTVYRYHRHYEP